MTAQPALPASIAFPADLESALTGYPTILDRRGAAHAITRHLFQVSPRTLERWPVATARINGRAHAETRAWFGHAMHLVREAASIKN
jgi:hypothetical protein